MTVGVINFPASLDDLDTLIRAADNAITTLASPITSGSTTISLTSAAKFSSSGIATLIDNPASPTLIEIFSFSGKSSNDLTGASRGLYGTTASAFSAGATVVMRPVARHHGAIADLLLAIEQKIGYSSSVFRPLDASGTNQAGNNLDITGGAGTGNAEPGIFGIRYPLRGASGSALQALSTDRFPPATGLYSNTNSGSAVANTTTETSLFTTGGGVPASAGSTRTLEAGITKAGTCYRVKIHGVLTTTGTPTIQYKLKFGSTLIVDSTAITAPNNSNGHFEIVVDVYVYAIGASGQVRAQMRGELHVAAAGAVTPTVFVGAAQPTIDFTAAQTFDLTAQWGTANASNSTQILGVTIERLK